MAETLMKHSRVYRGGSSTSERKPVPAPDMRVRSPAVVGDKEEVELRLALPVSGGHSMVHVLIGTDDFPLLLKAMTIAHRDTALHAMAEELSRCLTYPLEKRRLNP